MDFLEKLKQINWIKIICFYGLILLGTFLIRKLPNLLQLTFGGWVDFNLPWNMNHGLVVIIIALLFYQFSGIKKQVSFIGNSIKTIIFPIILFVGYFIIGIENDFGINKHLWAGIFIAITFIYNVMEEYAWRGYLNDALGNIFWMIKSVITGILWAVWHLLIFNNFDQFGSFWIFMLLCIVFSFLLTFSTFKTKSIIAPASLHALMAKNNFATLGILLFMMLLLIFWNKIIKSTTTDKLIKA
ncbi:CPBP family intramembrane glutamic endopeptidase [Chishuiella changwenlii]|uniref:CPBP family intramembrane glutamic endopeptidase n=1 Tax=Chishuiella changwenlii TaxID=1434701 RepID=UPI002FDB16A0